MLCFLLRMHFIEDAISSCTMYDDNTGNSITFNSLFSCANKAYLWLEVEFFLPHCLDVLPAGDASHGSFLLLGSAVHRQQLGRDRTAPRLTASLRCCWLCKRSKWIVYVVTPGSRLSPASERSGPSSPPRWTRGSCTWWAPRVSRWPTWLWDNEGDREQGSAKTLHSRFFFISSWNSLIFQYFK